MPDLVIGRNTYQNIDYIRFQKSNGAIATFMDSENRSSLKASLSHKKGLGYSLSTSINFGDITTSIRDITE